MDMELPTWPAATLPDVDFNAWDEMDRAGSTFVPDPYIGADLDAMLAIPFGEDAPPPDVDPALAPPAGDSVPPLDNDAPLGLPAGDVPPLDIDILMGLPAGDDPPIDFNDATWALPDIDLPALDFSSLDIDMRNAGDTQGLTQGASEYTPIYIVVYLRKPLLYYSLY